MQARNILLATSMACLALGIAACEKKGPFEKAGDKIDETARTIKNGGEKTTQDKVKDAAEDVKDGAKDAADELKK